MNLKKQAPVAGKKLVAGGERLSLSDFQTRETTITPSKKLDKITGGETDSNPRPPLVIMTR